jgi:hypothetical protein
MNTFLKSALLMTTLAVAAQASAQVTFYEREGFDGRTFTTERKVGNFERFGFNDRASSVVVSLSTLTWIGKAVWRFWRSMLPRESQETASLLWSPTTRSSPVDM